MNYGASKIIIRSAVGLFVMSLLSISYADNKTQPKLADVMNKHPYISTYHIKPRVNTAEKVVVDYYVTDYFQKEYRKGDVVENFTIEYWINGAKHVIEKVYAGDRSIDLGVLPEGKILFALQATDKHGVKSHRLFHEFLIVDPASDIIPADKILLPDLGKFKISNKDTDPVETTAGLNAMLKWASANGYRKVVLPKGIYRIDENAPVQMATDLTLDMGGATFKLNSNAKDKCLMFDFVECSNSHVINGVFEGDLAQHDFANAPNNSEWVNGISMSQGSEYCSVENVTVKGITGSGVITTHGLPSDQPQKIKGFAPGDVDDQGRKMASDNCVTTDDFIDIEGLIKTYGWIQLGCYPGDQGNPLENWGYRAHFYDASKKHIESIEGYLYRRLYPPANAVFAKLTLAGKASPEALNIFNLRSPYNCAFINIKHENIRSAGMSLHGFDNLLVEGCRFTNCGRELAKSAFYAKDGLDLMHDLTFTNNVFGGSPNTDFTAGAGHNFIIEGNANTIDIGDRVNSYVLRKCNRIYNSLRLSSGTRVKSGYCRVYGNGIKGDVSISDATKGIGDWKLVVKNCWFEGRAEGAGGHFFNCRIGKGGFADCEISGGTLADGEFSNCHIHDMKGNNRGGVYRNCKIERVFGHMSGSLDVDNCQITDWQCAAIGKDCSFIVKNSKLSNFLFSFGFWFQGATTIIEGCTIDNWDYMLRIPTYALKKPVTLANNTFTTRGSKGMVAFYHDVVGKSAGPAVEQEPLTLKNNTLNLGDSDYVVTGLGKNTKQKVGIVFEKNTVSPKNVQLYAPEAKESANISIVEK